MWIDNREAKSLQNVHNFFAGIDGFSAYRYIEGKAKKKSKF